MKNIIFYKEKSTIGTGSDYEQAQGHELWAHMLTFKLFDSSKQSRKNKFNKKKTTTGTGSGCEQAQVHQLRAYMLTMKLMVISKLTWTKELHGKKYCRYW